MVKVTLDVDVTKIVELVNYGILDDNEAKALLNQFEKVDLITYALNVEDVEDVDAEEEPQEEEEEPEEIIEPVEAEVVKAIEKEEEIIDDDIVDGDELSDLDDL